MAGVAGPMLSRSRAQGTRFLLGLMTGGALASTLLAAVFFALGTLVGTVLPDTPRYIAAAIALAVFGGLDVAGRTPHIWRQVPQALVRTLPPWRLGAVWGFDLSLLFTTQKSTSLTWGALTGCVLISPSASWAVLIGMTMVSVVTIAGRSVLFALRGPALVGDRDRTWFLPMRRVAGIALMALAAAIAVQGG
ncbi:hypothetical protein [Streptomyces cyslabdanicus]|uniref:hypothetical protein n=1 Tax=Streptomyces cyslabdanicus TaxID=1470456 RepID=UPI004043F138